MTDIIGRKRYNIDQPSVDVTKSIAGSGFMILVSGTTWTNPEVNIDFAFNSDQMNMTPQVSISLGWA